MGERGGDSVNRVLGGSPLSVFVRLVVLSFVVGLVLHVLNINPTDILVWIEARLRLLTNFSFGALEGVVRILLLGAVIVVPVWLVMRALRLIGR